MKSVPALAALFPLLAACGSFGAQPEPAAPAQPVIGEDSKAAVRKQEAAAEQQEQAMGDPEKQQVDQLEKQLVDGLKFSLGQKEAMPGMPPPESASTTVTDLRKAKIKLRLEPVTDQNGKPVADSFLQVKNSYADRVMELSRKMSDGKATAAEKKEIQAGAKYAGRLNDLSMQLGNLSRAAVTANSLVQSGALTTLLRVSNMLKTRKQMEMDVTAEDYAKVKTWIARQRRVETIGGLALATVATYQGVLNEEGNPAALDELANASLKAFPVSAQVTDDEAKAYVKNLTGNIAQVKAQYEAMMRKTWGDTVYEQRYKSGIDAMFAQADPSTVKSASQIAADAQAGYDADLQKCARGEAISAGSLVGPARCKQAREATLAGKPIPKSLQEDNAGQGGGGLGGALGSFVGGAMASFPMLNVINASLEGIAALQKGDVRGALKAAAGILPGPAGTVLKQGLQTVDKVLAVKDKVDTAVKTKGASLVQQKL